MKVACSWRRFRRCRAASLRGRREQAVDNIKEAISLYLESLAAHVEPVPPPITEELVEVEA
jgi:hypothetical protein